MADINWEQLCRNGQLIWQKSERHKMMLERFYLFYKGTADEQMIASKYPEFYALKQDAAQDATIEGTVVAEDIPVTVKELPAEAPKKRGRRKKSDSVSPIEA